mmetsp:Transcript_18167/g.25001  ORF Transcript_18167/g.25001 Transcript_18167/m.25001 type:complete len:139 (-) Transcript_18167:265-681(-)|eukprot:CAMPEP_0185735640 /NCGR_PEP_ID=MMETSP1171-20130828/25826_1 /TAXON_ID=374046 /ORGANISM="Helicotheca tamensis, Strain CCMP826" /LENGTH=138 /DNA_ID=CAMNT_0028406023 /DNA_START=138 /DNA_END=554 /DNA_ORIENTATION=+
MRSALRHLCMHGMEALLPQKLNANSNIWIKPKISRRIAATIRKQAIIAGTYGSFDKTTGIGWDPQWDNVHKNGQKIGRLKPPKLTKRERTRESRALKIEEKLKDVDEKIEQYRVENEEKKPKGGLEWVYKKAMKGSGK